MSSPAQNFPELGLVLFEWFSDVLTVKSVLICGAVTAERQRNVVSGQNIFHVVKRSNALLNDAHQLGMSG